MWPIVIRRTVPTVPLALLFLSVAACGEESTAPEPMPEPAVAATPPTELPSPPTTSVFRFPPCGPLSAQERQELTPCADCVPVRLGVRGTVSNDLPPFTPTRMENVSVLAIPSITYVEQVACAQERGEPFIVDDAALERLGAQVTRLVAGIGNPLSLTPGRWVFLHRHGEGSFGPWPIGSAVEYRVDRNGGTVNLQGGDFIGPPLYVDGCQKIGPDGTVSHGYMGAATPR